jgi:NAD-dependent SIR2 family protein deacetylase
LLAVFNLAPMHDQLNLVAEWLHHAEVVVVLAGAGMGADSGLPTFRDAHGLWQAYPPLQKLGVDFAAMANPRWFDENPALAWGFYGHRLQLYREATPHIGYDILGEWSEQMPLQVITSNVDGHFHAAGLASVWEVHGSIHHLQCSVQCSSDIWSADDVSLSIDPATLHAADPLPRCPRCGAIARPNILMFHDGAWLHERSAQQEAAAQAWLARHQHRRVLALEIGAGMAVPTIRLIGREWAAHPATPMHYVRINPDQDPYEDLPAQGQHLHGGAAEILGALATERLRWL